MYFSVEYAKYVLERAHVCNWRPGGPGSGYATVTMAKDNSVELKIFEEYEVDEILEFATEEKDGRTYVHFICCKVYARQMTNAGTRKYARNC